MSPSLRVIIFVCAAAVSAIGAAASRPHSGRLADALAVATASGWVTWWRVDAGPSRWDGPAPLASHLTWHSSAPGVERSELLLRGPSEARRTRAVIVRLDPRRVDLSL